MVGKMASLSELVAALRESGVMEAFHELCIFLTCLHTTG